MKSYTQLTEEQRYQIYEDLTSGYTQTDIAKRIGVNKSTVCRELQRNTGLKGYRPKQAHFSAMKHRKQKSGTKFSLSQIYRIECLIRHDWSPEQISGWLSANKEFSISHEWIYLHIYADKAKGGDLYLHLRCQKQRKKRYGYYERRGEIKHRISIDERPDIVDQKTRFGDWEADTITGTQSGPRLVTVNERKSRYTLVGLAEDKSADAVSGTLVRMLRPYRSRVKTITYDNGKEFAQHQRVSDMTQSDAYFAHPYQSWERGLNENTNGLLRQYFPKGSDFSVLTDEDIIRAVNRLNNRPRKCLNYKTPNQVFSGINPPVALAI